MAAIGGQASIHTDGGEDDSERAATADGSRFGSTSSNDARGNHTCRSFERCTAAALKAYCKEKGLKTTGVKSALAERVKEHALDGGG